MYLDLKDVCFDAVGLPELHFARFFSAGGIMDAVATVISGMYSLSIQCEL
jgi:hypothetical protein